MNKRGSSYLLAVGEVLAVVIVMIMVIYATEKRSTSESVTKINVANSFFLMINTLVGNYGDALVEYPYNLSKFNLVATSNSIGVSLPGESSLQYKTKTLNLPEGYSFEGVVKQAEKVCLEKKSKKIILRECAK